MELGYPVTFGVLLVFFLVAFLPPRMHLVLRILIQAILGAIIYFGLKDATFGLPDPDQMPISELFGGSQDGTFNRLSFGFLAFLLSAMLSVFVALVRFLLSKRTRSVEQA